MEERLVELSLVGRRQVREWDVPSIRILINRICIAFNGFSRPNKVLRVISVRAAAAVLSWKAKKLLILWNIDLPSEPSSVLHPIIQRH